MKTKIALVDAMEPLDSRGNPIVRVTVGLEGGTLAQASVPSGASTGEQVAIALDPAVSSFAENGGYDLSKSGGGHQTSAQMTDLHAQWVQSYPIVLIEDGLAENDWAGFASSWACFVARLRHGQLPNRTACQPTGTIARVGLAPAR